MRLYYGLGADHLFGDHPKVASKHARFDVVESGGRILGQSRRRSAHRKAPKSVDSFDLLGTGNAKCKIVRSQRGRRLRVS